jgi:beta-phosphoglucomutase
MALTPPGAVVWDMDGTLVDTADLHFAAWVRLAQELGHPFSRADFVATFGRRNPEILRQLFGEHLTDPEVATLGERKENYYRAAAQAGVELLPGVRPLVEALHAAGFRQAIGSSAPRGNLELILRLTNVAPFFQAIVAMEDTQRGKPDPEVFLVAAQRLGVPPARSLVLEDAVAGVEAAKAAGMRCIAVTFVGHHAEDRLRAAGADLVAPTLEQVSVQTVRSLIGV